jgi:hypothetical protein
VVVHRGCLLAERALDGVLQRESWPALTAREQGHPLYRKVGNGEKWNVGAAEHEIGVAQGRGIDENDRDHGRDQGTEDEERGSGTMIDGDNGMRC